MKKLMIFALALGLFGCGEIDNYKEPTGHITGRLIDAETKEPIPGQGRPGSHIRIYQFYNGVWSVNHSASVWVMPDGTFQNHRVFSGLYKLKVEGPFVPVEMVEKNLPADNIEIEVLPYFRMTLDEITLDENTASINAKFTIERPAGATTNYQYAMLYGNSESLYYVSGDGKDNVGAIFTDLRTSATIGAKNFTMQANAGKTIPFEGVDLTKPVYFRIAARNESNGVYWNYSSVLRLK